MSVLVFLLCISLIRAAMQSLVAISGSNIGGIVLVDSNVDGNLGAKDDVAWQDVT